MLLRDGLIRLLLWITGKSPERRRELADRIYPEGRQMRLDLEKERKERRSLQRASEIDPLTKLPNDQALNRALPTAEADPYIYVLLFDGDNFGQINKVKGHEAGDLAIIEMAQAIRQAAVENGVGARVFRRGRGDEFAVLAPKANARRIIKRAEELFGHHSYPGFVVSLTGASGSTFAQADTRLQPAKEARKRKHPGPGQA